MQTRRAAILWMLGCVLTGWPLTAQVLPLPERPTNAPSGSEFAKQAASWTLKEREREVRAQILSGNVPEFLRKLCPVRITNVVNGVTNSATFFVTPDYLAIGSNEDYLLLPLTPQTAQSIADALACSLPTRKMVDAIYSGASVKLAPSPIPPSRAMTTMALFSNHNATIRAQRIEQLALHPLGELVAGHKKDVVLSSRLESAPGKVAIYGWHQTNGAAIQPLYLGHTASWVDYSQCIRLVQQSLMVNGRVSTVAKVLADPDLAGLLSDEGPIRVPRYSTNALPAISSSVTNSFRERVITMEMEPEVTIQINEPPAGAFAAGKPLWLVFYALPNGNTIAQTVGKTMQPGDDWHFDIQHIGAQTRFLRERVKDHIIVVAYLENALKSWPAWRKQYGDKHIPEILAAVRSRYTNHTVEIFLSSHSGGGSLIFGYLNSEEKIPDDVTRIAFLDSDYAYQRDLGHRDKLAAWLKAGDRHFLCVLAYNDAVALLDGKPFVSAAGGTWGKSHEMERDLSELIPFNVQTNADFQRFTALDGRAQFILKENPERKILHTVQVERNGFIHSILSGTSLENDGYEYFGPRAYSQWIQSE